MRKSIATVNALLRRHVEWQKEVITAMVKSCCAVIAPKKRFHSEFLSVSCKLGT